MKPFEGLPLFGADLIMIDPPWNFETWSQKGAAKGPAAQYSIMSLDDIKALPVGHYAKPDCLLWLWATNPMLPRCIDTLEAWGFVYKTAGSWDKKTVHGKRHFGTGYILRNSNEPYLIGTIGKPKTSNSVRSSFDGVVREHSRKPEDAYENAEMLVPDAQVRLDLFSRQQRPGWIAWGDETDKFEAAE